jgi:predicted P-loop ATPase
MTFATIWPTEQGDEPTEATESEILPSQAEVSAAIEMLTKESDPDAIKAVIEKIAAARLEPLWDGSMISRIRDLTAGQTIQALRAVLKDAQRHREASAPAQPQLPQISDRANWRARLILDKDQEPKPLLANICEAIGCDETWKGVLGLNKFTGMITLRAKPPWPDASFRVERPWTDADTHMATWWVQAIAGIHAHSYAIFEAIATVAEQRQFHPVCDYLDKLKWDGAPRLDAWPIYYLGCDDTPLHRAVGAKWMISAVARVYEPGCKADCAIILEGRQGLGKSSALRVLFDPWFTDEIADLGSKDAAMQMRGKWVIELAELDSLSRSDVSRVKAFMSRSTDRFRPPYGRSIVEEGRQCVFGGSVNDDEYLKDPTGGRRWWPLKCGESIDLPALAHDRDQLWAEAVARYHARERWYLDDPGLIEAAVEAQADRYVADAWEPLIEHWLDSNTRQSVTTAELLHDALDIKDKSKWTKNDQARVGACLKHLGWKRGQVRDPANWKKQIWRYVRSSGKEHEA